MDTIHGRRNHTPYTQPAGEFLTPPIGHPEAVADILNGGRPGPIQGRKHPIKPHKMPVLPGFLILFIVIVYCFFVLFMIQ